MKIQDLLEQFNRETLEGYCQSKTQYAYLGNGEALTRVLGKYMMYVHTEDVSLVPHFILNGFWESWITQALLYIQPGMRCIDVGANHGYYSLVLAELSGADVYAFEPQPKLARLLRKTANVNGFRNQIHVAQAAVGAKSGVMDLILPEAGSYGGVFARRSTLQQTEEEEVLGVAVVVTLDDEVPGEVGFIKIDAEGFEPHIWAGMQRHLQSRPTILMEFSPHSYEDPERFLDEIKACYTLREVVPEGIVSVPDGRVLLERPDFSMLWLEAD